MADYNIYIHAIGTGTQTAASPIVPWSQKDSGGDSPTQSWSSSNGGNGIMRGLALGARALSNPSSLAGSAISSAFTGFIIYEAAKIVIQTSLEVWNKHADWYALQTGDYSESIKAQNEQVRFNILFNPISALIERKKTQLVWRNTNLRNQQERDLLGDSVINSYTNRGV